MHEQYAALKKAIVDEATKIKTDLETLKAEVTKVNLIKEYQKVVEVNMPAKYNFIKVYMYALKKYIFGLHDEAY